MSDAEQAHPPIGDLPEPQVEAPELHPGGPDAIEDVDPDPVVPELPPERNPAVDAAPVETREAEDTSTEATESADGEPATDAAEESPA